MKYFVILAMFVGGVAGAESELACWNMYAKRGSKPVLKADITKGNGLANIRVEASDRFFELYIYDNSDKDKVSTSEILNPDSQVTAPVVNTNKASPYYQDNEYKIVVGRYSYRSKRYNNEGDYAARWVLPPSLDRRTLSEFRIRDPKERSNSVMIVPPPAFGSQSGSNYLRMFCVSR